MKEFSEEPSTKAQGLIGTESLTLRRASEHFKACLAMCLVEKISITCPCFHREVSVCHQHFCGSPGLSCSARTFRICVHLIVSAGVCDSGVGLCSTLTRVLLPVPGARPWSRGVAVVCVCVCYTTSDPAAQCCCHVLSQTVYCIKHTLQTLPRGHAAQGPPWTPEATRPTGCGG